MVLSSYDIRVRLREFKVAWILTLVPYLLIDVDVKVKMEGGVSTMYLTVTSLSMRIPQRLFSSISPFHQL